MSYFLCGEFVLNQKVSTDTASLAFDLVSYAASRKLGLQLGPCIIQPVVFEIIGNNRTERNDNFLPFLITESPISDVSDDLLDMDDLGAGTERINNTLERLRSFLESVGQTGNVSMAKVFFSEGYDDRYVRIEATPKTFVDQCMKLFSTPEGLVSLQVDVDVKAEEIV